MTAHIDKESAPTPAMQALADESYPYRLRDGDIIDAKGRRITVPGNLGVAQLLNTIVELRQELRSTRSAGEGRSEYGAHHDAEVRKHWDYLINKYADMPPRFDTSNEVANLINDARNLAGGIRRYTQSAKKEDKNGTDS